MPTVSAIDVVSSFDNKNAKELKGACDLADKYWLGGIPLSVLNSKTSREFGKFMDNLSTKEQQEMYAMVHTMMTASKLS